MPRKRRVRWFACVGLVLAACQGSYEEPRAVEASLDGTPEARERCAIRLSTVLLGQSPSTTLIQSTDPQASVDTMLGTPQFIERFARFINASFNRVPGTSPPKDAPYYLAKYIL